MDKEVSRGLCGITRDGDLIGTGLTREQAEKICEESVAAYPDVLFKIIPQPKGPEIPERWNDGTDMEE